jgi:hypothetical protein
MFTKTFKVHFLRMTLIQFISFLIAFHYGLHHFDNCLLKHVKGCNVRGIGDNKIKGFALCPNVKDPMKP